MRLKLFAMTLAAFMLSCGLLPGVVHLASAQSDDDGGNDDGGNDRGGNDDGGNDRGGDDDGGNDDGGNDDGGNDDRGDRNRRTENDGRSLFDRLFDRPGREAEDHLAGEIIGYRLTPAERGRLVGAGFAVAADLPLPGLGTRVTRFRLPQGQSAPEALAAARRLLPGAVLDLNHLYETNGGICDPPGCWGARMAGLQALPRGACRRATPVAIIDSLPDPGHPSLRGVPMERRSFLPKDVPAAPGSHGTAVAAILVGTLGPDRKPLAPGVRLLAAGTFRLRDGATVADAAAIVQGIDWALTGKAEIIGLSLAGPANVVLGAAVESALPRASLVAAAGNSGPKGPAAYPAAYEGVFAVAAVDARKRPYRQGNRGDYIDIAAPGVEVVSAADDGGVANFTGTSFAVPYAIAALLRARSSADGNPAAAERLLRARAEDLGQSGTDPIFGAGLLNAPEAKCR